MQLFCPFQYFQSVVRSTEDGLGRAGRGVCLQSLPNSSTRPLSSRGHRQIIILAPRLEFTSHLTPPRWWGEGSGGGSGQSGYFLFTYIFFFYLCRRSRSEIMFLLESICLSVSMYDALWFLKEI